MTVETSVQLKLTCDNNLSPTPVAAALVSARAHVHACVTRLDFGEVQLCPWINTKKHNESHEGLQSLMLTHLISAVVTWSNDRDMTAVRRTLLASVGAAGDGSAVFSGPVEIVRRTARHLTPQGDGAALGRQNPLRVNPHHQGSRSCKRSKVKTEATVQAGSRKSLFLPRKYTPAVCNLQSLSLLLMCLSHWLFFPPYLEKNSQNGNISALSIL